VTESPVTETPPPLPSVVLYTLVQALPSAETCKRLAAETTPTWRYS
jgi:hypothetical protein